MIWVSISPCICNESTKMLRLPMKRAQAIPLYGWQNPSSSKSSLRHTERQMRECRSILRLFTYISMVKIHTVCLEEKNDFCRQLQMPKPAAIHDNSTRGQSMFEYDTKPTLLWKEKVFFVAGSKPRKKSPFAWLKINHIQVKGRDLKHTHIHTSQFTAQM